MEATVVLAEPWLLVSAVLFLKMCQVLNWQLLTTFQYFRLDSAAYDACLVVENPSAREVKSVYDNIPDPQENTYKALDPTKREPSVKYQSLIRNDHEVGFNCLRIPCQPYPIVPYRTTYPIIPYHTIPYHTIAYHSIPYHTIAYHNIHKPYHTPYNYTTLHHTTSSHTIPCHTTSHNVTPYHTMPHHITQYHSIPHHITSHHTIPYSTTLHDTIVPYPPTISLLHHCSIQLWPTLYLVKPYKNHYTQKLTSNLRQCM